MASAKYDAAYRRERKRWERIIQREGRIACRRVGFGCVSDDPMIYLGEPWDLGHPDATCQRPMAPEHRGCNRGVGGREGAAVTNALKATTVRDL